jgi:hypothetical protein
MLKTTYVSSRSEMGSFGGVDSDDRDRWWAFSGFKKCGEFLDQLRTCQLLRKESAP